MKIIKQHFNLVPFAPVSGLHSVAITGHISRCAGILIADFVIKGDLADIGIPEISETGSRKTRLWEQTCFELFIAADNSPSYREFNFSPDGHWNVYMFKTYREGMAEEPAFTRLPFQFQYPDPEKKSLSCRIEIDLNGIGLSDNKLEVSANAVTRHGDNTLTHWAVAHSTARPDFHSRDNFVIKT